MRKLIVSMNVTLDGFTAAPNGGLDWHFESWTTEMGDAMCSQLLQCDTVILGRATYDAMAGYWPLKSAEADCHENDFALASMLNNYTKVVYSKTLTSAHWNNTTLVKGNIGQQVKKLKQQPGKNIIIYGSGKLAASLSHLVDEYQLWLHPAVTGKGKKLFKSPLTLKLVGVQRFSSGVLLLCYHPVTLSSSARNPLLRAK